MIKRNISFSEMTRFLCEKISIVLLIILCVENVNAQVFAPKLKINTELLRTIRLNQSQEYKLSLAEGQFGLINLEQKGIDVKIISYDPNGKEIETFDTPNGSFGSELIVIDADQIGDYTLKVVPLGENKRKRKGSYSIELISLSSNVNSHLDKSFKLIGDRDYLPGFFISIINDKKTVYSNGQGYANVKKQIPYTINTIQQIESISKTFIGLSIMILVEQGKLDLDEDINTYLPFKVSNPYFPDTPITLRHLATHTASINERNQRDLPYWIENKEVLFQNRDKYLHKSIRKQYESVLNNEEISIEDFLKSFFIPKGKYYSKKNFFKKKEPGKEWYYSNVGATLSAYIVQLVSEQPYDKFVESYIINPLKLENTSWGYNLEKDSINALKYDGNKTEYPRVRGPLYPDGGIYSSTADLSQYLMHWMKGYLGTSTLLKSSSYKEIMSVHFEEKKGRFKGVKNGLYWWMFRGNKMGHNGGSMGSNVNMFFYPDKNVGYISLENMEYGESGGGMTQSIQIKKIIERYIGYFK